MSNLTHTRLQSLITYVKIIQEISRYYICVSHHLNSKDRNAQKRLYIFFFKSTIPQIEKKYINNITLLWLVVDPGESLNQGSFPSRAWYPWAWPPWAGSLPEAAGLAEPEAAEAVPKVPI